MEEKVRRDHLTQAEKQPQKALDHGWFQDPAFCEGYFDRCENHALHISPDTLKLALKAVEIAVTNGDPHLVHRSHGVLVHAHIASADLFWAGRTLESYRDSALACCPSCRSDFFYREGDLLGEERKPAESLAALDRSLAEGGRALDDDFQGRHRFLRSIAYHHAGERDRALADAGEALRRLSLESPQGYFLDTVACIVVFWKHRSKTGPFSPV